MTPAAIRGLIAWTIGLLALAVGFAWVIYLASDALLLVYISVLLAIGFGPIVRWIERKPAPHVGARRLPRWVAILVVYVAIVGVVTLAGFLVIPPLVDQAQDLSKRLPDLIAKGQKFLIERGILTHSVTLEEAVANAPGTPAGAVGRVATAVGRVG